MRLMFFFVYLALLGCAFDVGRRYEHSKLPVPVKIHVTVPACGAGSMTLNDPVLYQTN